jgi:hypothetical protein
MCSLTSATGDEPVQPREMGRLAASQSVDFVLNQGQWSDAVVSATEAGGMSIWFERDGWMVDLQRPGQPAEGDQPAITGRGVAVRMRFLGSDADAGFIPSERVPGVRNYLIGNDPSGWASGVPAYARQRYEGLYPGIDVVTMGEAGNVRYDLHLAPGASLGQVTVRCEGADALEILYDGSLVIHTELGPIVQPAPRTWAVLDDGATEPVSCVYRLLGDDCFGFEVPGFDGEHQLVIDPTMTWGTFLGGTSIDMGWASEIDSQGRVTAVGFASPTQYPTTTGAYDLVDNGSRDGFVTRLEADGKTLIFSTLIGGAGLDEVRAVALDVNGGVVLGGVTNSANFPMGLNSLGRSFAGGGALLGSDAFLAHLDELGGALLSSSYLGGGEDEFATAVAVDVAGRMFITGSTLSADFPTTAGSLQPVFGGGLPVGDAYLVCLTPDGSSIDFSTFLGGSNNDLANALMVDPNGELTLAGWSTSTDFDVTSLGFQSQVTGWSSGFAVTLSQDGSKMVWGSMIGGNGDDTIMSIARDPDGRLVIAGTTSSWNFPLTSQALDVSFGGGFLNGDAFVTRFDHSGTGLSYSSYLGGNSDDIATGVAVAALGQLVITGSTMSSDWILGPDPLDTQLGGYMDAFVTVIDATEGVLLSSSYLGGYDYDKAWDVDVLADGQVFISGYTTSSDFPVTTDSFDPVFDGAPSWISDGFVVSLDLGLSAPASSDWINLGHALAGAHGEPALSAIGSLSPQDSGALHLSNGLPSARGRLLFGTDIGYTVLKGGVLVPNPIVAQLFFFTDVNGEIVFPASNSGSLPSGLSFVVQVWIEDDTGPFKWTASNALQGSVP